jgi:ABC-type spermidine/putrescine transport system permease subunit I
LSASYEALSGRSSGSRLYGHLSNAISSIERRRWAFLLLLLLPLIYLVLLYGIPVLLLTAQSLLSYDVNTRRTGGLTLENYTKILSDPDYLRVLLTSLRIGFLVTVLDLVIGYPVAYLLARVSGARKQILLAVIVAPLLVSIVIRTFSWAILLRSGGPVNQFLMATGLIGEPLQILNREPAVVIALVHVCLPFMIIPLSTVIESIDPTLELAASTLGANVSRRLVEVIFPLSIPGILAGCMLVLTTSVSAYVTPAMLSGNTFLVMPTLVQQQMQVLVNWSLGSAIAVELIVVVLAIVWLFSWLAESASKHRRA